jgi:hypothetical protein
MPLSSPPWSTPYASRANSAVMATSAAIETGVESRFTLGEG